MESPQDPLRRQDQFHGTACRPRDLDWSFGTPGSWAWPKGTRFVFDSEDQGCAIPDRTRVNSSVASGFGRWISTEDCEVVSRILALVGGKRSFDQESTFDIQKLQVSAREVCESLMSYLHM